MEWFERAKKLLLEALPEEEKSNPMLPEYLDDLEHYGDEEAYKNITKEELLKDYYRYEG